MLNRSPPRTIKESAFGEQFLHAEIGTLTVSLSRSAERPARHIVSDSLKTKKVSNNRAQFA